ncbi:putative Zn-dependent protease, involved in pqq synthesis (ppqF) [Candidatus Methylomirabilis oxygeniifera]|uniref:Putative Zn-dependent protease, involved in pqq synthesis (PpqF) n=1 Tax=Methylomirabilis oxygeniifera TaxID=671143 RepID=D5MHK0_METO1|nr:putative Zn-dependent protease, involved in pqq synthesis (ppqF) [Candidatus Methylomirabilis oxyfera]
MAQGVANAQVTARVTESALDNGLKILLLEEHKAPVVTVHIWYRVGGRNEQPGTTGLSHLLEHMMFKGTSKVGPGQFSRIIRKNGGRDNAFTSEDYTGYFETFASDRVELALKLEADRMRGLLLDSKEIEAEKKVVMEERRLRTEDDPVSALREAMGAAAFQAHPYRQPIIGWMTDIERITREDLVRYYNTYYVPNNAVLIVVGDFNSGDLLPKIRQYFGPIPRAADPPAVRSVEPEQRGERRVLLKKEAELPFVFMGYHVPNLKHPDNFALEVLAYILSGGKSARIYKSLVYEQQLALFAGGGYDRESVDPNLFPLYASVMPGKTAEEIERALTAEIEQVKNELISDRELQKVKNQIEADFLFGQDSIFNLARVLAEYEIVANWRTWEAYLPGIRAVTAADLQRVARAYLTPDNRTVAVLIPEKIKK